MKKLLTILLTICMSFVLFSCSEKRNSANIKIGMLVFYGDVTDQSYHQSIYESCKEFATENNFEFNYYKLTGDHALDATQMIEKAIGEEGCNVVIIPSNAFTEQFLDKAKEYKDVRFIAFDISESDYRKYAKSDEELKEILSNIYSINFKEEIPGFMAGYAAVKLGYRKLGFLGGKAMPSVKRYGYGFIQGADLAAQELGLEDVEIKYSYGDQFFGDKKLDAAMDRWYKDGTQVIFACGGAIYASVAAAAKPVNGKVIGVDTDQSFAIDSAYGENMTVTSAMKSLSVSTKAALASVCENQTWNSVAGTIDTLGLVSENPDENYVGIPTETTLFDRNFTVDDYKSLTSKIFTGQIEISTDINVKPQSLAKVVDVEYINNVKSYR